MTTLTPAQLKQLQDSAQKLPDAEAKPRRKAGRPTAHALLYDQLRPIVETVLKTKKISIIDTTRWLLRQLKITTPEKSTEWHRWQSFVTRTHRSLQRPERIHSTSPTAAP